jgi:heparosan-N-sulfate-glucuronate 5-epimerase
VCCVLTRTNIDYPVDLRKFSAELRLFDSKGIPLVKYPYGIGVQYNPVTCCQFALSNLQLYLSNHKKRCLDRFFDVCEWLYDASEETKYGGQAWYYHFHSPYYPAKVPYLSCMSQGQAISVFVRAYVLTEDESYLQMAGESCRVLQTPLTGGGVLCNDDFGVWLEEMPTNPPSHILNGYIFAIFGVYDLFSVTKEYSIGFFLDECADTLCKAVYAFDNGYWSIYDLLNKCPSTLPYHNLHIEQLRALYKMTKCVTFNEVAERFESYRTRRINYYRSVLVGNALTAVNVVKFWGFKSLAHRSANRIQAIFTDNLNKALDARYH